MLFNICNYFNPSIDIVVLTYCALIYFSTCLHKVLDQFIVIVRYGQVECTRSCNQNKRLTRNAEKRKNTLKTVAVTHTQG